MPAPLEARDRPWEDLPPGVAAVLRPALPGLTEAIIGAIAESIPEYKRPIEGSFGRALRVGVEEALGRFVALIEDPAGRIVGENGVYRSLGRGEMRAGRSLDSLQAAYRLGARVAWRHLADAAIAAALPPETLPTLAEAIFAYIDELAAESVEGYAEAQSAAAGERGRRRSRLLELLLDEAGADRETVRQAAERAGWTVPRSVAAVALGRPADADALARRLGPDVLPGSGLGGPCLLVPDPDGPGRADLLAGVLDARSAAIGPAVDPLHALASLRPARRLLGLAGQAAGPPLRVEDRLVDLALDAGREPLARLADRRLAPLDDRTETSRERLAETLLAWLELQGSAPAVARRLHVHPQTVRYRLARLREALGDDLDDPDARFELLLALRARALPERA